MNDMEVNQRRPGTAAWLPLVLFAVLCCAGPLLIAGLGTVGLTAVLTWIADPWMQVGAAGLVLAGIAAVWRGRIHRRDVRAQAISGAPQSRTLSG